MGESQIWLVTGGAGYVGSHVVDSFLEAGKEVVVYDDLSSGLYSRIEFLEIKHGKSIPLILGDIRDKDPLEREFKSKDFEGIVHTAALKSVSESFSYPDQYMSVNYEATKQILGLANYYRVNRFLFSSSAAVYGFNEKLKYVSEDSDKNPISPYGISKLLAEEAVREFLSKPNRIGTSFRFFNVVGTGAPQLIDNSTQNVIPIFVDKIRNNQAPLIFGSDYETNDGTCVRDYVDVRFIANLHLLVSEVTKKLPFAFNVGTGDGVSVLEVLRLISKEFGVEGLQPSFEARRQGDPETLCADMTLLRRFFDIKPQYSIEESILSLRLKP